MPQLLELSTERLERCWNAFLSATSEQANIK
jgi:hypothetical protein